MDAMALYMPFISDYISSSTPPGGGRAYRHRFCAKTATSHFLESDVTGGRAWLPRALSRVLSGNVANASRKGLAAPPTLRLERLQD